MTDSPSSNRSNILQAPDQRLRVFVSSSLQELAAERSAACEAIEHLRLTPVAPDQPSANSRQSHLEQSNIFIGLYWQKWCEETPDLEAEYQRSGSKPKLIYIKNPAPNRESRLKDLIDQIKTDDSVSYKYFEHAAELSELIENDLAILLTERFMQVDDDRITAPTSNLLTPRNPLLGREREMTHVKELLLRPDVNLVTLTGAGGTGKSRLGLQLALELKDRFKDGAFLVPLAPIADAKSVVSAIAKVLNVRDTSAQRRLIDSVTDYLHDKHILLLIDNFEHVITAATEVAFLLEACPHIKALVTSRTPLHLRNEKEYLVRPLALPEHEQSLQLNQLSQYAAVELFIQRARSVKTDFEVTDDNAPAIAEICYRLDGLPLAIELAAARIRILTPQMLLARLEHRFDVLRGGTRDLPERQHTLRRAIDWSYNLLDKDAQQTLQRLSVFSGGWTLAAAESVCNEPELCNDVYTQLEILLDNNLLNPAEEVDSGMRFSMLETIREYAHDRLIESGNINSARQRHARYYLDLADRAGLELHGAQQKAWLAELDHEHDNMRTALHWLQASERNVATSQRLAYALLWYWYFRGYWIEGRTWIDMALDLPQPDRSHIDPKNLRGKASFASGHLARLQGEYTIALARLKESIDRSRTLNDQSTLALALSALAPARMEQDHLDEALALTDEAVKAAEPVADRWVLAFALNTRGNILRSAQQYDAARSTLTRSVVISKSIGDRWGQAAPTFNLALLEYWNLNYPAAQKLFHEALDLFIEIGDKRGIAYAFHLLGEIERSFNNTEQARIYLEKAWPLYQELGSKSSVAGALQALGNLAHAEGDYERALACFKQSLKTYREVDYPLGVGQCLAHIAGSIGRQGRAHDAARLFGCAEILLDPIESTFSPTDRAQYERNLEAVHQQISDAEFKAAWAEGKTLKIDQIITEIVEDK